MLNLNFSTALLLYLGIMVVLLVTACVIEELRDQTQNWKLSEDQLCNCSGCRLTFVVRRKETVARCPRCHNLCSMAATNC